MDALSGHGLTPYRWERRHLFGGDPSRQVPIRNKNAHTALFEIRRCRIGQMRPAVLSDVPQVNALERDCGLPGWRMQTYQSMIGDDQRHVFVAIASESQILLGFYCLGILLEDADLWRLAVRSEHQGRGLGELLLEDCLLRLQQAGLTACYLEVRSRNAAAIHLYSKGGFQAVGRRPSYYQDPVDDAILMRGLPGQRAMKC